MYPVRMTRRRAKRALPAPPSLLGEAILCLDRATSRNPGQAQHATYTTQEASSGNLPARVPPERPRPKLDNSVMPVIVLTRFRSALIARCVLVQASGMGESLGSQRPTEIQRQGTHAMQAAGEPDYSSEINTEK